MYTKHLIKKSMILGTIFLLTLGLIFPIPVISVEPPNPDPDDGVWTDNFEDNSTVILNNCSIRSLV